jgi:hypothetical protein
MKTNKRIKITDGFDETKNETYYPNIYENIQKQKLLFYLEDERITTFNKINEINNNNFKYTKLNINNGQLYKDWNSFPITPKPIIRPPVNIYEEF